MAVYTSDLFAAEMKSKHSCGVAQANGSCGQRSLVLEEEGQEGQGGDTDGIVDSQ